MSGKITLLEALEPDVLRILHENQKSLQQLLRAAPKPYVQTVVESGGKVGKSVTENIDFSNISIPIQYSDLLEILISGRVDGISPYFKRMEMTVPAGMTMSMVLQIPNQDTAAFVYRHLMDFNYYSKNILVTMQEDDNSPIVASAKAVAPLNLAGAFMRPVQNSLSHTVVNNASLDVEMYMDVQAVLMSPAFVRQVFVPLLSGQAEAITRLAETS